MGGWLAMKPNPVIARSKATWQSMFQVVRDDRWIASPSARNDDGGWLAVTVGRLAMTVGRLAMTVW